MCLAFVWVVGPALLLAQGDLNLEELADRSQVLTDRVDALEALWIDSEPRVKADGSCINGSAGGFRDATVPNYKTAFDAWPDTGSMRVFAVNHDPESGIVGLQYEKISDDEFVAEFWQGCEFLASTDWWSALLQSRCYGWRRVRGMRLPPSGLRARFRPCRGPLG